MTGEWIMDALDLLDEDMAEEVGRLRERRPRKPSLLRYGMIAAGFCVTLLCVLQLMPLMGRIPEDGVVESDVSLENMEMHSSGTGNLEGMVPTVSENEEWSQGETAEDSFDMGTEGASEGDESHDEGIEDEHPETDEKPSVKVRIEGFDGELAYCTVVENVDTDIFPVGTNLFISFEKWKDAHYQTIKPEDLTVGMEICVMFTGYDGDIIFAVMLYE